MQETLTKKNAIILTVAIVCIFGLMIALLVVAMSEPTLPPPEEIVEPVEVVEKTEPLDPEQLKAKNALAELKYNFQKTNNRRGLQALHRGLKLHPTDYKEQMAYFQIELEKSVMDWQPASTGTLGGARAAGMELAKKTIGEQGVFPTTAKYPWANVKTELMRDTGQFKVYRVTGTVESGSRSAKWTSHILSNNEVYACTAVYVNGTEVWSLSDE